MVEWNQAMNTPTTDLSLNTPDILALRGQLDALTAQRRVDVLEAAIDRIGAARAGWESVARSLIGDVAANPKLAARPEVRALCAALIEFSRAHLTTGHLLNGDYVF